MVNARSVRRKNNDILLAVFAAAFIWACSACITDSPVKFYPDAAGPYAGTSSSTGVGSY